MTFFGLDARPFEGEAVSVEAQVGEHGDVLRVEVVVVAGVAGGLFEDGFGQVFHRPEVGVGVVAFDLIGGGGAAPKESIGEGFAFVGRGCSAREVGSLMSPAAAATEAERRRWRREMDFNPGVAASTSISAMVCLAFEEWDCGPALGVSGMREKVSIPLCVAGR